ncbi:MAG: alpha-amylase family glycosyl hydrolase [Verrucomicrobiota bacterium]
MTPLCYEINTRCWLRDLSSRAGRHLTLDDVPAEEFERWQRLGCTHIWLMGVWVTGPLSRSLALREPNLRRRYQELLPDWQESDVGGSPYAIGDYRVMAELGGERALSTFRAQLHRHGLKLILDFVPNHLGLDHPWLRDHPERFVLSERKVAGTFRVKARHKTFWVAHGRDPYFPPWNDTAQLDYRRADTRKAMREQLLAIAEQCDGVRCDMAMLLLEEVFAKTWADFPVNEREVQGEFWRETITAVKKAQRGFLFLAEAYWNLEGTLQRLGFDFTYDKAWLDHLARGDGPAVQRHLLDHSPPYHRGSARFLENHDEPRIASRLSLEQHRAAALLLLGLPGLRLLHEGQLEGRREHVPVQLARRPIEPVDREVAALYQQLLALLPSTAISRGHAEILQPTEAWEGNFTAAHFVVVQWQAGRNEFDLVVVNLASHRAQCRVRPALGKVARHRWKLVDLLGQEVWRRDGRELEQEGLFLDLPAHGAQLFRCLPADGENQHPG